MLIFDVLVLKDWRENGNLGLDCGLAAAESLLHRGLQRRAAKRLQREVSGKRRRHETGAAAAEADQEQAT